jgi:phosphoglycerate kinase
VITHSPPPRRLKQQPVTSGQRWIFSAGFNVADPAADTSRIDIELSDLARLANCGARVAILSHQGSYADGTARHLEEIACYLSRRLARPVGYHPDNASSTAAAASHGLRPGEMMLFGNTRHHAGEETGDPALARQFAQLGDYVALGGFSKAHRQHASNTGILEYLPGWAADSLTREIDKLAPWAGSRPDLPSAAIIGGVKPEKTLLGLTCFSRIYDLVVPGGAVLNHTLAHLGYAIGSSTLGVKPSECARATARAVGEATARIHIPSRVVIARPDGRNHAERREIAIADGVPPEFAIVDFLPEPWLLEEFRGLQTSGGRVVVAGTPNLHSQGFIAASRPVLDLIRAPRMQSILLGGDTVAELPWGGVTSTGGGSALYYLKDADLPILRALEANARRTA